MDPMERLKVSREGATVTNSWNTVSWVGYEPKKGKHAIEPGMEGSWKRQILHWHHCSNFEKNIYTFKKKKRKKEKKRKKNQIGTGVPVHPQCVLVHLMKK